MTALTAVVLQAAIADPDLVHAHLADHNCWPALLAVCTSQPSTAARQHAQRVHQLSSSNSMPAPASSGSGLSTIQPEELCGSSNAMTHSRDRAAGWHAADDITPGGTDQQQPHSQTQAAKGKALDTTAGAGQHDGQGMWLGPVQATPGAASHVAQLTTCLVQSQSGSNSGMSDAYAGIDSLTALLHCYVAHASLASCPLAVPVWPAKVQQQQQQHAMLEHAAQAGERLYPSTEAVTTHTKLAPASLHKPSTKAWEETQSNMPLGCVAALSITSAGIEETSLLVMLH